MNELLFPHFCLLCQKENFLLCPDCQKTILINHHLYSSSSVTIDKNFLSATFWEDPLIKKLIYLFKYEFVKEAGFILGNVLIDFVKNYSLFEIYKNIVVVPVPLHPKRLLWRGFNQAELLAESLAKEFEVPLIEDVLKRHRHSTPQMVLRDAKKRKYNVSGAFSASNDLSKKDFQNTNIFLIDDVSTTGSTLNECAQVLKKTSPQNIFKLVIAQA